MPELAPLDWLYISMELMLAAVVALKMPLPRIRIFFVLAALASALWHFHSNRLLLPLIAPGNHQLILEILRYLCWLLLLLELLMLSRGDRLPKFWTWPLYTLLTSLVVAFIWTTAPHSSTRFYAAALYGGIFCCLLLIVVCEQLLRHDHSSRMSKLVALSALTLFSYDIFVFSATLLAPEDKLAWWAARTEISSATAFVMALGSLFYARQLRERSRIQLSHSVILFNTSLTLAGAFFILMALFVSVIRYFEIDWLLGTRISIYVMAAFILVTLFFAEKTRHKIAVWASKHFFAHKYDYKRQWITLDSLLAKPRPGKNSYDQALYAICQLFSCYGGGLWLKGPQFYSLVSHRRFPPPTGELVNNSSAMIKNMEASDWVYQLNHNGNGHAAPQNELPDWLQRLPDAWVVVPLNGQTQLDGFVVLCKKHREEQLSWEDLDLLKLTGRQLASYIRSQQAFEKLTHNQQFEMFNKLTAFAIHDIKNLVAQQSLVVKNAAKFKHQPEFIEDAIATIAASVKKMEQLLIKLKGNTVDENARCCLQHTMAELLALTRNSLPVPALTQPDSPIMLKIDKDKLLMVLSHLLKNAQDACGDDDEIDISIEREGNGVWIHIRDTGCGMSDEFIKEHLFRPFRSTKNENGLGLGAYQIRELVHQHKGELLVQSSPGSGSHFAIYLPVAEKFSETQTTDL